MWGYAFLRAQVRRQTKGLLEQYFWASRRWRVTCSGQAPASPWPSRLPHRQKHGEASVEVMPDHDLCGPSRVFADTYLHILRSMSMFNPKNKDP